MDKGKLMDLNKMSNNYFKKHQKWLNNLKNGDQVCIAYEKCHAPSEDIVLEEQLSYEYLTNVRKLTQTHIVLDKNITIDRETGKSEGVFHIAIIVKPTKKIISQVKRKCMIHKLERHDWGKHTDKELRKIVKMLT